MADYTPTWTVRNLSVERNGTTFTASWKVPSEATQSNRDNCFTGIDVRAKLLYDAEKETGEKAVTISVDASDRSASFGYDDLLSMSGTTVAARNTLAPNGKAAQAVRVEVRGWHRQGGTKYYGP